MFRLILFLIFYVSIFFTGFKKDSNPVIPEYKLNFPDSIPYSLLSNGLICFERISDAYHNGVCIIDINNQK